MKIIIPANVKKIMTTLTNCYPNCEVYAVGGCVRDSLLGLTPHDWDLTTNLRPEEISNALKEYQLVNSGGLKHGTVSVCINHQIYEITTFRFDGIYEDGRHPKKVNFGVDLKTDLERRDFTINAMAYNDVVGLVDLFGGEEDLKAKLIKCVGNPYKRFSEDYLRILRALRFASKFEFKLEEKTSEAIIALSNNLKSISKERIKKELEGILVGNNVFYILKKYANVFEKIIPELKTIRDFKQNNPHHIHQDLYEHTINVVRLCENDFETRMAALLHDLGKPDCYSEEIIEGNIKGHFYGHPLASKDIAIKILTNLKFSNKEIENITYLVLNHDSDISLERKTIKRMLARTPNQDIELFKKLVNLRKSDQLDHTNLKPEYIINESAVINMAEEIKKENLALKIADLKINGEDVMQICQLEPSTKIGEILNLLLEKVLDEEIKNTKEELIAELKKIKN